MSVYRVVFGSRSIGFWVFLNLLSVFLFNLYWFTRSSVGQAYVLIIGGFPSNYEDQTYWISHIFSDFGTVLCFFGLLVGMWCVYLVWGARKKSFSGVRNMISISAATVGLFYLAFFPSGFWLLTVRPIPQTLLALSYFAQPLLATPVLFALAFKVARDGKGGFCNSLFNWFVAAYVGIIAALWVSDLFVWFQILDIFGISFLQTGGAILGFLNSAILSSASLVSAIAASFSILKKTTLKVSIWLVGLSMVFMGMHFIFYVVYYASVGALSSVMLGNLWALPLLGLGVDILRKITANPKPISTTREKVKAFPPDYL